MQVFQPARQRDEVVSGKLAHLGREIHSAIGHQDLGLADSAGVEDDMAGRGVAGMVLVADAEVGLTQRDPDTFAGPADVHDPADVRQVLAKGGDRLRRALGLETAVEGEGSGGDLEVVHG